RTDVRKSWTFGCNPDPRQRLRRLIRLRHSEPDMRTPNDTTAVIYDIFICGMCVASSSGTRFENRNPADTDDLIGRFQESTPADAESAIAAATRAYADWRLVPAPRRAEILFRAAQLIADRKETFA